MKTILSHATRMLGDPFQAEDVTQTVFLKTWQNAPKWEPGRAKLITWMRRVTTNLCLDILRKKKPIYTDTVPDQPDDSPAPFDSLAHSEQRTTLDRAMSQLPGNQKAALTLSYYEDVSQRDGADILGISISAYESLLARARRGMKKILETGTYPDLLPGA